MMIANLWRWTHDFDRRVTAIFRGGELCAVIPHEVGIAGPSVEDRAQFIVDACNEKEQREERQGECPTCGPKPHTHVIGITGRGCAEDYCSGYWDNIAWYEKHKAHTGCGQPEHGSCAFCSGENTTTKCVWPEDA